ncbi:MAG: 3-oxoacid CoA-transferase subunit A [Spirochaetes bacterium]|nr:3-oxoacid CoA-transferase subunit A [Spirochaetota bacterium]
MKNKVTDIENIKPLFKDGMRIMIGGFLGVGTPENIIDLIIDMGLGNLTVIGNDSSYVDRGIGRLIAGGRIKKYITTHLGTNPEAIKRYNDKSMEVEFNPQGTLIERIRAGGAGLGGVLTQIGLGTLVEHGKRKVEIDGKEYILELPLRADMALIRGSEVDPYGNTRYFGTSRNYNPTMALAADTVIVQAENIVDFGDVEPENFVTPGVVVDYIIEGNK